MRSRLASTRARSRWLSMLVSPWPGKCLAETSTTILGIGMRAVDVGGHVVRDVFRIFAVRANVDDGILRIVVDVGDRREDPLDAQRARFAGGGKALMARGFDVARRARMPC